MRPWEEAQQAQPGVLKPKSGGSQPSQQERVSPRRDVGCGTLLTLGPGQSP